MGHRGSSVVRRAAHFFTFFDGGANSARAELSVWEAGIMPIQFYGTKQVHDKPEHALCYAVLEQAIAEFQGRFFSGTRKVERLSREAEAWFLSRDTSWPFSFERVCESIDINSNYLRAGIVNMGKILAEKQRLNMLTPANKFKIRECVINKKTGNSMPTSG